MATQNQINANRLNAKSSTGPRTDQGKSTAAYNAVKSGLFAKRDFVRPADRPLWHSFRDAILARLQPADALEQVHADEIVSASWRLRLCAARESIIAETNLDTYELDYTINHSLERARSSASRLLKRATDELRTLQTERLLHTEIPQPARADQPGIAKCQAVLIARNTVQIFQQRDQPRLPQNSPSHPLTPPTINANFLAEC